MKSNEVTAPIGASRFFCLFSRSEIGSSKKSYNFSSCWFSFRRQPMWFEEKDLAFLFLCPFIPGDGFEMDSKCFT